MSCGIWNEIQGRHMRFCKSKGTQLVRCFCLTNLGISFVFASAITHDKLWCSLNLKMHLNTKNFRQSQHHRPQWVSRLNACLEWQTGGLIRVPWDFEKRCGCSLTVGFSHGDRGWIGGSMLERYMFVANSKVSYSSSKIMAHWYFLSLFLLLGDVNTLFGMCM